MTSRLFVLYLHCNDNNKNNIIMKNQTAVEWLINEIDMQFPHINIRWKAAMLDKALELEEKQIKSAFADGEISEADYFDPANPDVPCSENYYNENYKS